MEATRLMPLELWREIALTDVRLWHSLTRVVRGLDNERDRKIAKNIDIQTTVVEYEGVPHTEYRLDGQLHRDRGEGPAVIGPNGYYCYYKKGLEHRDPKEGPASGNSDGHAMYYWMGNLHRDPEDGPAFIPDAYIRETFGYSEEYRVHGKQVEPPVRNDK